MSDNRPSAYTENNISIYRASAIGSCTKTLVASKMGYKEERSPFTHNILTTAAGEGNLHEDAIIERLKKDYGWRIWGGQDIVEDKVIPNVFIRGHVDGVCIPKGKQKERVLEIKTMSKDRFKKWKASGDNARERLLTEDFAKYGWQISVYMHAYGMYAMYVVKNRDSGELDISEIALPPVDWKTIRKKVIEVEMWVKRDELPPCDGGSGERFFCPFPYLHEDDGIFGVEDDDDSPLDDATNVLVAGMAEHYVELAKKVALLKPLDEERKGLGKKIIEAMGGNTGTKKMVARGYAINRVDNTRKVVDVMAVAKELGVELEEYDKIIEKHKRTVTYPYVKVKKLGDK